MRNLFEQFCKWKHNMLSLSLNLLLKERAWDWNSNGITSLLCACLAPIKNMLCPPPSVYLSVKQIVVAYLPRFETENLWPTVDIEFISLNLTEAQIIKTEKFLAYILSSINDAKKKKNWQIRKMKMQTQRAVKVTQMLLILI